jgi:hypothetical protein
VSLYYASFNGWVYDRVGDGIRWWCQRETYGLELEAGCLALSADLELSGLRSLACIRPCIRVPSNGSSPKTQATGGARQSPAWSNSASAHSGRVRPCIPYPRTPGVLPASGGARRLGASGRGAPSRDRHRPPPRTVRVGCPRSPCTKGGQVRPSLAPLWRLSRGSGAEDERRPSRGREDAMD